MRRRRLDTELVRRGLVASPDEAVAAVRAGLVTVGGGPATNEAALVAPGQPVHLAVRSRRFVSRGGEKLDAALAAFGVDPAGRECLDAGASTGGFTDRLLHGGAARVVAVDVGYGQLAWELRTDDRVVVLERTNVRDLRPGDLAFAPSLVTADLSFASLVPAIPAFVRLAGAGADLLLLVKPQFETPPADVPPGGVVRDPLMWRRAIERVGAACDAAGAGTLAAVPSPIRGPAGNIEFLLHARLGAPPAGVDAGAVVVEVPA
jgi:23S rRNA (cytidine1920-2'-O)/16S rRNA (cytidine1409-2'-O)-methyltransferase